MDGANLEQIIHFNMVFFERITPTTVVMKLTELPVN